MSKIIIRKEEKEDYKQTELMTMRAFWNNHRPGCNEHYLVHLIREAECYLPEISRVAELDGKIVGTIMYSKAEVWDGDVKHDVITFGPLCVEPTVQSLDIGGRLLRETMELARKAGYSRICFFGEPEYYPKHGFVTCDHFGITDWDGNNYKSFMGCELIEGAFSNIKGRFKEPEIFEECDNEEGLAAFEKDFPKYPKLKLSCQWLHKERLGRICEVQKNSFVIRYWEQELPAKLSGAFYKEDCEFPVVGDYVTFSYNPLGESRILTVCERKSMLKRPDQSGHALPYVKNMKEQPMVSNFDYVFIVSSLNDNYNLNRILRYVTITLQGGGIPVVILTKADLAEHVESYVEEIQAFFDKTEIHAVCALDGTGLESLKKYLVYGKTIALLGSSGVGKSTLLNALAGEEIAKTGAVREKDAKGRHTTTYRQMITLSDGVTIIDTPGMRELGMCDVEEGLICTQSKVTERSLYMKKKLVIILTIILAIIIGGILLLITKVNHKIQGFENCISTVNELTIPQETKIVALGEATHGNVEFQQLKLDVLQVLVEKYGYRAFALEGDFGGCSVVNQYILGGEGTAKDAVFAIGFRIYDTQEMIDLVEWMREYNSNVNTDEQIRFYGFDMQRTEHSVAELVEIYEKLNSEKAVKYINQIKSLYNENVMDDDTESKKIVLQSIRSDLQENKEEYLSALSQVEYAYAEQYITCLLQGLELANAGMKYSIIRDEFMAENVNRIMELEKTYGNDLIMLSGHNGHVAMKATYRNMGEILEEEYDDAYYVIGTDFYKTTCNIANNNGRGEYRFCSKDPLAAQLRQQPDQKVYLDFQSANSEPAVSKILEAPMKTGSLGESFVWYMYLLPQSYRLNIAPVLMYDSMIMIYEATPTECITE